MLAAIPALAAAAYLAVGGLRRRSIGMCAAALGVLCAWGALSALVTQGPQLSAPRAGALVA